MAKAKESAPFLARFLEILVFSFLLSAVLIRPLISSIRAETAGPVPAWGFYYGLLYGKQKSAHFFAVGLLLFSTTAFVLLSILRRQLTSLRTGLEWPLVGLFTFATLSVFWTSHLEASLSLLLGWGAIGLFFYTFLSWGEKHSLETFLSPLLATGALVAFLAILEVAYIHPQIEREKDLAKSPKTVLEEHFQKRAKGYETTVSFVTSNILGSFLTLSLLFGLGLFLEVWDRENRSIFWLLCIGASLALLSVALALTRSVGAWLAFGVGWLTLTTLVYRRVSKCTFLKWGIPLSWLTLCLVGAVLLFWKGEALERSLRVRWDYAKASGRMISQHMATGVGLNSYRYYYSTYKTPEAPELIRHAHNDYLQIFAELGLGGILCYLALWFLFLRRAVSSLRQKLSPKEMRKAQKRLSQLSSPSPFWVVLAGLASFILLSVLESTILSDLWIGVAGALLWLGLGVAPLFCTTLPTGYRSADQPYLYLRMGLFSAVVAFLFHSLGSFVLYSQGLLFWVCLFVGLFFLSDFHGGTKKTGYLQWNLRSQWEELLLLGGALALLALIGAAIQGSLRADVHILQGDSLRAKALGAEDTSQKIKLLRQALEMYSLAEKFYPLEEKLPATQAKTAEMIYNFSAQKEFLKVAAQALERAVARAPRDAGLLYRTGLFYSRHPSLDPRWERRRELFETCVAIFPTHPRYHFELALTYLELARRGEGELVSRARRHLHLAKYYNRVVSRDFALLDREGRKTDRPIEDALKRLYALEKK